MSLSTGPFLQAIELARWFELASWWQRNAPARCAIPASWRVLTLPSDGLDHRIGVISLLQQGASLKGLDAAQYRASPSGFSIAQRRWALTTLQRLATLTPVVSTLCASPEGRRQLLATWLCAQARNACMSVGASAPVQDRFVQQVAETLRVVLQLQFSVSSEDSVLAEASDLHGPVSHNRESSAGSPTMESPVRGQLPPWVWDSLLTEGVPHPVSALQAPSILVTSDMALRPSDSLLAAGQTVQNASESSEAADSTLALSDRTMA